MATYRVKQQFSHIVELTTLANGKRVALNGAYTKALEAQPGRPAQSVQVPGATQADLEWLHKNGNPTIEEGETVKEQTPAAKANG